ncbi:MAG: aspartate aminotransferase family protein, partial [Arenicellales bacterium]
ILRREGQYDKLIENGQMLMDAFASHLTMAGIAHQIVGHPTLFEVVFTDQPVRNYRDFQSSDKARLAKFTELLRENGVFKSVGKVYVSLALSQQDLDETEAAIEKSVAALG